MKTIVDMGHDGEERAIAILVLAGFTFRGNPINADEQIEIVDLGGDIKGHLDGLIESGPALDDITYPALWENKFKGNKYWNAIKKHGVEKAEHVYWIQLHSYMAYCGLKSALFTAFNRDSGELYAEVVQANPALASEYQERAVAVIDAKHPDELARVANDPTNWQCSFCDFKDICYAG